MSKRIRIGSRVSNEAWRFEQTKIDVDRWSYKKFGELWRDARIVGTVIEQSGGKWKVKLDIDGEISNFETNQLFKEGDLPKQGMSFHSRSYLYSNTIIILMLLLK